MSRGRRLRRDSEGSLVDTDAAPAAVAPAPQPVARLQRALGNQALQQVLREEQEIPASLFARVGARHGQGQALPLESRNRMEHAFGADLGAVRVHSDPEAGRLAQAAHARAFASGTDIYFAPDAFQPASPAGERLMAHEVAHVLQQATEAVPRGVNQPGDRYEAAADTAADAVLAGRRIPTEAPAQLKPQALPILQREIVLADALLKGLEAAGKTSFLQEFLQGLQTYLGIYYEFRGAGRPFKPVKSAVARGTTLTLFKENYQKSFGNVEGAKPDELAVQTLGTWTTVREQVFDALESKAITIRTMSDSESERRGRTLMTHQIIELNIKDIQNMKTSSTEVGKSYDGFWAIVHEILHITTGKYDESKNDSPGEIEAYLNPLRTGFGLPVRMNYGKKTQVEGETVVEFAGGGKATYPKR